MKNICVEKLKQAFQGDLNEYRSIPFWSWNNELDEKALVEQIDEMKKVGIGGFIIHARTGLRTEYLGEKWFSCVDACLKRAKELQMNAWIYDENGFVVVDDFDHCLYTSFWTLTLCSPQSKENLPMDIP